MKPFNIVVTPLAIRLAILVALAPLTSGKAHATLAVPASVTCTATPSTACADLSNQTGPGFFGGATSGTGVIGQSTSQDAITAWSNHGNGACGSSTSGTGLTGLSATGDGVKGYSEISTGVYGHSPGVGVQGSGRIALEGWGVGNNRNIWGVSGVAGGAGGVAVDASCTESCQGSGYGAVFTGSVKITGIGANGGLTLPNGTASKTGSALWAATSDRRVKKDVRDFDLGQDQLALLRPVSYRYNGLGGTANDGRTNVGVIAQEVAKIVPFMVTSRKGKLHVTDAADTDIQQVDGSAFTYMLINAVKQQDKVIEEQDVRIATLERGRPFMASSLLSPGDETAVVVDLTLLAIAVVLGKRRRPERVTGGAQ